MSSISPTSKGNNAIFWILQILMAGLFLMAGTMKLMTPIDIMAKEMTWINSVPSITVRIIGLLEVAGGLGLILPWLFKFIPNLTVWAAYGLALTMLCALILHLVEGQYNNCVSVGLFLVALVFLANGRNQQLK
jgi:uncharacterized membrane protein YphA (DoxX/SURF4 family)